jgi:hypothetical protein
MHQNTSGKINKITGTSGVMALTNYGFLAQDTIGNPSKIEGNPPPLPELNPRCAAEGRFPNQLRIKDLKKESDSEVTRKLHKEQLFGVQKAVRHFR